MCGSFGLFAELDVLGGVVQFDPSIMQDTYSPRWNIPPTVPVLTVQPPSSQGQSGTSVPRLLRWGVTGARSRENAVRPDWRLRLLTDEATTGMHDG